MESHRRRVEVYQTVNGHKPFQEWLDGLKDREGRAKIAVKVDRLGLGNLGGCKSLGGGLHELKVDFGPGYRLYFADVRPVIILLLCGGDKSTQAKDIENARKHLADYIERTNENKTKR
jgi:putative addiction module killer protein